jgi:hypothetical protein
MGLTAEKATKSAELPQNLHPRERELLQWTLQAYPDLTVDEALAMLKAFGGL